MTRKFWKKAVVVASIICLVESAAADIPGPGIDRSQLIDGGGNDIAAYFEELKSEHLADRQIQKGAGGSSAFDIGEGGSVGLQKKSVQKAFLFSFIVPGAGQLYMGSEIKAVLFAGVEVLSWYGYATYRSNGNDKTGVFEDYADDYWSRDRYTDFLVTVPPDHHFTHELPETNTQQYYEMIGKYDQFVYGWDDTTPQPPDFDSVPIAYSAHRLHYEDMRYEANQEFIKSNRMLILAMINHLAAAFEAALSARRHNSHIDDLAHRLSVKARLARLDNERIPMLTITYRF